MLLSDLIRHTLLIYGLPVICAREHNYCNIETFFATIEMDCMFHSSVPQFVEHKTSSRKKHYNLWIVLLYTTALKQEDYIKGGI